ncbi:MAG: ribbon-helix-helix protein, CopG family [Actinomycetota bacterium]|nr:ribbon-helix-helix protein, CopG family [Actinomycetota bacterium]
MSIQIAVRLPDQLVNSLDELVISGAARSRASVIERALLRELRYQRMLQEVEILNSGIGADEDLDSLARLSSNVVLDVD